MMIAPNSRARKEGKEMEEVKEKYRGIWGEEEGQQYIAPYVKCVEGGLGTISLRMVAAFLAGSR